MKKLLGILLLALAFIANASASSVSVNVITIASPKVGQAPSVNHVAATACYRLSWRTTVRSGVTVNYLTTFTYGSGQLFTSDNVFAATTYAEMQTEATSLGITNLPADPNAGH